MDKKAWSVKDTPGGPKGSVNGTYGRWRYVSSVNAFLLLTDWDKNVFFDKHTAGTAAKD